MKLLIATGLYPPETGGPATHTRLLEDYLPARGIEVLAVPFAPVRALPPVVRHLAYFTELWRIARDVDVILAQDAVSVGLPAALVAFARRKPLIVRVPGDWAWEQGKQRWGVTDSLEAFQEKRYSFSLEAMRRLQRFVVARAARVVVPSEYLRRIVSGWGPKEQPIVIYNGVDLEEKPEAPQHAPRPLIVTSARLVPWKGVGALLQAVKDEPKWNLVILGDGPLRRELEEEAKRCERPERIRFLGTVSHEHALGWYEAADVFVLNSSYEGLSHVLLEVMRFGTSIVATNIEGNAELIADGESGLLVPPGDTQALRAVIARVLSDAALARKLGETARARAQAFSVEHCADAFAGVVKDVCVS